MDSRDTLRYRYFDPSRTLQDLHGDTGALCNLANAYLTEIDRDLKVLLSARQHTALLAGRLRVTFGIFHASRGAALSRDWHEAINDGREFNNACRQALLAELLGLEHDLRAYLHQTGDHAESCSGG